MRPFSRILVVASCTILSTALTFAGVVYSETSGPSSLIFQTPAPTPSPDPATTKVDAVRAAIREADTAMSAVEERTLVAASKSAALENKCTSPSVNDRTAIEFQQLTEQTIAASSPSLIASI